MNGYDAPQLANRAGVDSGFVPWQSERRDIVIGLRHQPVVMVIEPDAFKIAWVRSAGVTEQEAHTPFRGTVVGPPLSVPDIDGDGIADLVAMFAWVSVEAAAAGKAEMPQRRVEALSGATGHVLWEFSCDDTWFQTAKQTDWPLAKRWFPSRSNTGSMGGNDYYAPRRNWSVNARTGEHVRLPDPPMMCRVGGKPWLLCAAGSRVVLLDRTTGKPYAPPVDPP